MKYKTLIFLWFCWSYCSGQHISIPCPKDGICPFHKVLLKDQYELHIGDTINNRRTIRLTGHGMDTILRAVKLKTPNSVLGWLAADNEDVFALYTTYSGNYPSGQPLSIYVYEKKSGKLLLSGPLIEYDSLQQKVLFIDMKQQQKLGLLDMNTLQTNFFEPVDTRCESWWWCINHQQITDREVIIEYKDSNDYTRRKIYVR